MNSFIETLHVYLEFLKHESLTTVLNLSKLGKELKLLNQEYYIITISTEPIQSNGQKNIQIHLNFSQSYEDDHYSGPPITYKNNKTTQDSKNDMENFTIDCFVLDDKNFILIKLKECGIPLEKIHIKNDAATKIKGVFHLHLYNFSSLPRGIRLEQICLTFNVLLAKNSNFYTYYGYAHKSIQKKDSQGISDNEGYVCFDQSDYAPSLPYSVNFESKIQNDTFNELGVQSLKPMNGFEFEEIAEDEVKLLDRPKGLIGLPNIGNTCYMNVTLQCLLNAYEFAQYFLKGKFGTGGFLAYAFQNLYRTTLESGNHHQTKYLSELKASIHDIKTFIDTGYPEFKGFKQNDADEFLRVFLQKMSEDVNRVKPTSAYKQLAFNPNNSILEESDRWIAHQKSKEDSIVHDLFGGQLLRKLTCLACKRKEHIFDYFLDLPLILEEDDWYNLEDMLKNYNGGEDTRELFCKSCQENKFFTARTEIFRFPKILTIVFKRFKDNNGKYKKVNSPVYFPIKSLDLRKSGLSSNHTSIKDAEYSLFAMIKHHGNLEFGHYTAECKNPYNQEWYILDDIHVRKSKITKDSEYQHEAPYLLIVFRIGLTLL